MGTPLTLNDWGLHHKTDKATHHGYCDFYEARIGEPKSILEFGVLNGASLKMWHSRYAQALVIGIDPDKCPAIDNVIIKMGSCLDDTMIEQMSFTKYDLIIDDASHKTSEQIEAFEKWWPLVSDGGMFIIEDIHTMHYDAYNPTKIDMKAWVTSLGLRHEYFSRVENDESDSMTLIIYKP